MTAAFVNLYWDLLSKMFFTKVSAQNWLKIPNNNFGGSSPESLIKAGRAHKVVAFLQAVESGY